jgi:hypothetical protein
MKQDLEVGDRVILYHMEDERMSPGEKGTVDSINFDPFEDDNQIIGVIWDDGSTLALLTKYDYFKKIASKPLQESSKSEKGFDFLKNNRKFLVNFDVPAIKNYLTDLRDSGIVNMFTASPYLYSGEKWISDKHGSPYENENMGDDNIEAYEKVLANAESIKNKFIDGAYKNIVGTDKDLDISDFNREVKKQAVRLLNYYLLFT